jgi:hypothetical protein
LANGHPTSIPKITPFFSGAIMPKTGGFFIPKFDSSKSALLQSAPAKLTGPQDWSIVDNDIEELLGQCPNSLIVIDKTYQEYSQKPTSDLNEIRRLLDLSGVEVEPLVHQIDNSIRVTVGNIEENNKFLSIMKF